MDDYGVETGYQALWLSQAISELHNAVRVHQAIAKSYRQQAMSEARFSVTTDGFTRPRRDMLTKARIFDQMASEYLRWVDVLTSG